MHKGEKKENLTSAAKTRHGSKDACEADNTNQCSRHKDDSQHGHGKFPSNRLYNH